MDVDIAGLLSFEAAVLGPRRLGLQVTQVVDAMFATAAVEPERETFGFRNSCTTASRSSGDTSSVLRSASATASCAGVSVV